MPGQGAVTADDVVFGYGNDYNNFRHNSLSRILNRSDSLLQIE
jgi:hypothetical protein